MIRVGQNCSARGQWLLLFRTRVISWRRSSSIGCRTGRAAVSGLGNTGDVEELLIVIHRNGWTTLQDVVVNTLIDAAERAALDVGPPMPQT
jgi:hypothetical protein